MDNDAATTRKFYGEEDVAALIRALDREEDFHIFAEDVLKTYPYLAESYTKVCPRRCDLATAAQKALDGAYSFDVKLKDLKADIALMVSNCIAYNGPTSAYAETAAKFERFALDQIDRFIVEHNGGRRLSRLRLPPASQTPQEPQPQQRPQVSSEQSKKGAAADKKTMVAAITFTVPTIREVTQLVDSLNRREDGGAFAVDVAEAYPDLRESYQKMCPRPMNLVMMHQRAKEGYYTAAEPLFGATVAASLVRLREDVELLVRNCITFNAKVDSWVALARAFQSFAHRRIDDFVLRHAAALRGTQTGAETYMGAANITAEAVPVPAPSSTEGKQDSRKRERAGDGNGINNNNSNNGHATAAARSPIASSAATAPVTVVGEVTPQVCATPLQPSLTIPPRLRRRLALEHVQHTQLPLRRVGVSVLGAALYPGVPTAEIEKDEHRAEAPRASSSSQLILIDPSCSAGHVISLLEHAIADFFAAQRSRPDFADTFAFSQREERLYRTVLHVIAEQFEQTAPHLLLYERESAELAEWTALQTLATASTGVAGQIAPRLADQLHYLYLVRFLVQWPQVACLCCTSTTAPARNTGAGAGATATAAPGSLRISRDQLRAMAQVALITEEFLNFVEKIEERVSGV